MVTKKITLNELRTLVKQIIKEETVMRHGTYMVYTQHTPDGKWIGNDEKIDTYKEYNRLKFRDNRMYYSFLGKREDKI